MSGAGKSAEEWTRTLELVAAEHEETLRQMREGNESKNAIKRKMRQLAREHSKKQRQASGESKPNKAGRAGAKDKRGRATLGTYSKGLLRKRLPKICEEGPKIVLDMSFVGDATLGNKASLAQQLLQTFGCNTHAPQPSKLVVCGTSAELYDEFKGRFDIDKWEAQGTIEFTKEEFQDKFEKKDIVYLSSEATEELKTVDPGKAYIIGGILDRNAQKGATANKAATLGLSCARLPLDSYLEKRNRGDAKKVLAVNHVAQILLDMASCADWDVSLDRNVPTRRNINEKQKLKAKSKLKASASSEDLENEAKIGTKTTAEPEASSVQGASAREPSTLAVPATFPSWRVEGPKPPVALVVGASSGIGLAFARQFRAAGWTVIMVARNAKRLGQAASDLRALKAPTHSSGLDPVVWTIPEDCAEWGGVIRVCNAVKCLWPTIESIQCVVASSGTFKWDDDPVLLEDPQYLIRQNLSSRAMLLKESLRLLGGHVKYDCRVIEEQWLDFEIRPFEVKGPQVETSTGSSDTIANEESNDRVDAKQPGEGFQATFISIGSEAGSPGFQDKVPDTADEQKYIESMQAVRAWHENASKQLAKVEPRIRLELIEPPLIDTPMARREFSRLGLSINWADLQSADDYVADTLKSFQLFK